jgi:hypothetical protein
VTAVDLAAADPLPIVLARLRSDVRVKAALGLAPDADAAQHVGARNEAPFPRLIVTDPPGGSNRGGIWLMGPVVQIEAVGDLDERPGKAALRRLLYTALQVCVEIPDVPTEPGQPVITAVTSDGSGGWVPLPNGQPRYLTSIGTSIHPPLPVP